MKEFEGKVAVITGAGNGFGVEIGMCLSKNKNDIGRH